MIINSDGSMKVEVMLVVKEQENDENQTDDMITNNDTSIDEAMKNNLESHGFIIKDYKEEGYAGQVISKVINSIDEVTSTNKLEPVNLYMLLGDEEGKVPPLQYYFYKNNDNYVADFIFEFIEEENKEETEMDMSSLFEMFDIKYKVTLPEKSISNNAHSFSEDGKTLTWDIKYVETNPIKFEFSLPKLNENIKEEDAKNKIITFIEDNIIYIGIDLLLLLIVIMLLIYYIVKRNKKEIVNEMPNIIANTEESIGNSTMENPVITPTEEVANHTQNIVNNPINQGPVMETPVALNNETLINQPTNIINNEAQNIEKL